MFFHAVHTQQQQQKRMRKGNLIVGFCYRMGPDSRLYPSSSVGMCVCRWGRNVYTQLLIKARNSKQRSKKIKRSSPPYNQKFFRPRRTSSKKRKKKKAKNIQFPVFLVLCVAFLFSIQCFDVVDGQ